MHIQHEVYPDTKINSNNLILPNQNLSSQQLANVAKVRERVLLIVGILLGFSVLYFILVLISYTTKTPVTTPNAVDIYQLTSGIVYIVYYSIGHFAARRYSRTGLLVFVGLGLVSLVVSTVIVVIAIVFGVDVARLSGVDPTVTMIIIIVAFFIAAFIEVSAIWYAYLLSKLLKHIKSFVTEQI